MTSSLLPRWWLARLSLALAAFLPIAASALAQSINTNNVGTGTGGVTGCVVGTTPGQCLAAAPSRAVVLAVQNESATASIACALGATATLNFPGSFQIAPGQLFTFSNSLYVPADAVNCIASAAATPATIFAK